MFRNVFQTLWVSAAAFALVSCGASTEQSAPISEDATVSEIIGSDMRNPELSAALNERITQIMEEGSDLQNELLRAGFAAGASDGDCRVFNREGDPQQAYGRDDTLNISLRTCGGSEGQARSSTLAVTFGDE